MKYKKRKNNNTRRRKGGSSRRKSKLVYNKSRKRKNGTKKYYQSGGDPSLVYDNLKLQEYTGLIKEIIGKDSEFNYILRTYYYEVRDNPDYAFQDSMEPPTQSSIEKIQQINLRLFCWIRDNVPGSTVVIPKGAILARTVSRKSVDQMNIEMKTLPPPAKPPKPGVFGNTSQLANTTVQVQIPIDSVMFMKTTRKLIYLNLCPFQHLMQTYWKTRMDLYNTDSSTGRLLPVLTWITGISTNTLEWCNSIPIQKMEYDGIIQTDLAESVFESNISQDSRYFYRDGNGNANSNPKVVGQRYLNLAKQSLQDSDGKYDNQVFQIKTSTKQDVLIFPEFLTYSYDSSKTLEVCDLYEEYKDWFDTSTNAKIEASWPNNIAALGFQGEDAKGTRMFAQPDEIKRLLENYNLPIKKGYITDKNDPDFKKYFSDFKQFNNDPEPNDAEDKKFKRYISVCKAFSEDKNFRLYSLKLYEDTTFQNFGTKITNISEYSFNQRKSVKIDQLCIDSYIPLQQSTPQTGYKFEYIIGPLYGRDEYQRNIDLLLAFKNDLCGMNKVACSVQSKSNECCDVQNMQNCDLDKYPGSFMTIKGDATNNFYYKNDYRDIVSSATKDVIDNIVYKPTQFNYPLYIVIYYILIKNNMSSNNREDKNDTSKIKGLKNILMDAYYNTQVKNQNHAYKDEWEKEDIPKNNLYKYVKNNILNLSDNDKVLTSRQEENLNFTYKYIQVELLSFLLSLAYQGAILINNNDTTTSYNLIDSMIKGFSPDEIRLISDQILESLEGKGGILTILENGIGKDKMYKFYANDDMANSDEPRKAQDDTPGRALEVILTRSFVIKMYLKKTSRINFGNDTLADAWFENDKAFKHDWDGFKSLIASGNGSSVDGTNFWSSYKESFLGIFFNIYLKGGTSFRLLFKRETLIEETCVDAGSCKLNRLTGYSTADEEIEETEHKINEKLGQPSDYDLNCVTNPWLGETDYKILVDQLNIQLTVHLKERTYVKFARQFNNTENESRNRMIDIQKSLANNYYNKDLVLITDITQTTDTASVEKDPLTGEKYTTSRSDINTQENPNAIPQNWSGVDDVDDADANNSFVFYSQGHMLWITSKLLEEATEFDLHRLMLHIPTKSVWINENKLSDRYTAIKNATIPSVNMSTLLANNDIEKEVVKHGPKIDDVQLKQIPTNVDAAIELIDISVVNWGGIEKFSKWHDSEIGNLRADYLFNLDQEVFFNLVRDNGSVRKIKAIITNVYSVPYYYDIVQIDNMTLKEMSPEDIKKNKLRNVHSSVLRPTLEKLETWSEGLQMYNFDNSIHDLSLVIDDNIKSGRVTKLLKRQRRRAFLAQLRYLFVNNNPSGKDFKDPDGPMEIFRFTGYEQFYYLLERPDDAARLIKSIFNTNISIDIPLLNLTIDYSPSVKLLNLDEWPRMYIILKSVLQKYADEDEYIINALNNTDISNWRSVEYDIQSKQLIERGETDPLNGHYVIRKDASGRYRKFLTVTEIYEKVSNYYIIKGIQQNLDFIYMNYLNQQEVPGRSQVQVPDQFSFEDQGAFGEEQKDALLKYFLNMLTFISIIDDKSVNKESSMPKTFRRQCLKSIITDMCNTLYVIIVSMINNTFDHNIIRLKSLCELRSQYVKKVIDATYESTLVSSNPTNMNKLRLSQQLRGLNKIGEWLDLGQGQANTVEFAKNNQLILELESCKGFYDTILNGNSDFQNFNKVTLNVSDKDKFKTFKQRLKDFEESEPELQITFNDDDVEGYNRIKIDYDNKYTFDENIESISIHIYSDLMRIYNSTIFSSGTNPYNDNASFMVGEKMLDPNSLQDPMNMWSTDWVGTNSGQISTSIHENRQALELMFKNESGISITTNINEMSIDSIFKYFEPISTTQMLLDPYIGTSIFKDNISNKLQELTNLMPNNAGDLDLIEDGVVKGKINGEKQRFFASNINTTVFPPGKWIGEESNILSLNIVNAARKDIDTISESWGSIANSIAGQGPSAATKAEEILGKFFINNVELRWNNSNGPQVKALNLNYENLSNIWGYTTSGDGCAYFCIVPSINNCTYRKMILNVNSIYVKNTLIQRLQSFGISSEISSDDVERVRQENERLKEEVQNIQTQATNAIGNYQQQNANLQQQAQNVQNILSNFNNNSGATVSEAVEAMKQIHAADTQIMKQLNDIYKTKLQTLYQKCNMMCQNIANVVAIWNGGAGNYLMSADPFTSNQMQQSINGVYYGCQNMTPDDFEAISDQQLEQAVQGNISGLEQRIGSWISSKESPQGNNQQLGATAGVGGLGNYGPSGLPPAFTNYSAPQATNAIGLGYLPPSYD